MVNARIVRRLIAFLKRPDAFEGEDRGAAHASRDNYPPQAVQRDRAESVQAADSSTPYHYPAEAVPGDGLSRSPGYGSRLDALVMRAIQQFNADQGYVIRHEHDGRMRYCTGRDTRGHYVPHTAVCADKRAILKAVSSGESQLFVRTMDDCTSLAILCGPLHAGDEVIGVLYLNNPARNRLYRGVFDLFCDQAARMLFEGVA